MSLKVSIIQSISVHKLLLGLSLPSTALWFLTVILTQLRDKEGIHHQDHLLMLKV